MLNRFSQKTGEAEGPGLEEMVSELNFDNESGMIFDLDSEEKPISDPISAQEGGLSEGVPSLEGPETASASIPRMPVMKMGGMSQIHEHILDALLDGGDEWESKPVQELARRLRSSVEELQMLLDMVDVQEVSVRRFEKLVERESIARSGYNWGRLEAGALEKLGGMIQGNRISDVNQLLRIAQVANSAHRRGPNGLPIQPTPGGTTVNVGIYNQNGESVNPALPGEGNLGTVTLTLTNRTVKQLSKDRVIDGTSERLLDRAEMLNEDDIKDLGKMLDGRDAG